MSLKARAAQSLAWTLLESAGLSVLSFVTLVIVARFVTPTELGAVTVAIGVVQILALPVEILFHDVLVQGDATNEASYNSAFTTSVSIAVVLIGACWAFQGTFSDLLDSPQGGLLLSALSVSLLPLALGSSLVARNRRELAFKSLALRSLTGRTIGAVAGIVCAVAGLGVWSLVVQQLAMTTCSTLLLWMLSAGMRPRLTLRLSHARSMAGFGSSSLINNLLLVSEPRVFVTLVAGALSPAAAGYLNLAFRVVDMPRDVMAGASSQLALPLLRHIRSDIEATRRAYGEAVGLTCMIGYPIFLGLAACAPEILLLVFGPRWMPSTLPVIVLSLLTVAFFPKLWSSAIVTVKGRPQAFTPVLVVSLATVIVGMVFVGHLSLVLALAVWGARILTSLPVEILIAGRVGELGVRDQFRGTFRPLLAATGMAALVWATGSLLLPGASVVARLAAMVVVGMLTYPALLLLVDRGAITRLLAFVSLMGRGRDSVATPADG